MKFLDKIKKCYGGNRSFSTISLVNRQVYYIMKWGNCMKMKDIEIANTGKMEIDIMELPENCVIIVSKGKAKVTELPAHAETRIKTYKGIVKRVEWNLGEDFA